MAALEAEPTIGVFLPCNVVVRAIDEQHTLVEAMDPDAMVGVTGNEALADVAADARRRLSAALGALSSETVREESPLRSGPDRQSGPRRTTSPTTTTAGACTPRSRASPPMVATVPTVVRWSGAKPRSTIATGQSAEPAVLDEQLGGARELGHAHEQHERVVAAGRQHRDVLVAGDDGEAAGHAAVGHRYAGCRGNAHRARHAGHHLDAYAVCLARVALLAAAAEHVGVAALEPDDAEAALRLLDEDVVDPRLGHRVVPGRLPDVDDAHRGREPVDDGAGGEPVDDDDVGRGEQLVSARRQQAVGAGPAADEGDPAVLPVRPCCRAAGGFGCGAGRGCRRRAPARPRRGPSRPDRGRRRHTQPR